MCFDVHPDHREPKTAESDIPCVKVLLTVPNQDGSNGPLKSPFFAAVYVPDQTMESEISTMKQKHPRYIEEGLHSFTPEKLLTTPGEEPINVWSNKHVSVKYNAVIPKGATYYHNPKHHEYVSDKLMITTPYKQN